MWDPTPPSYQEAMSRDWFHLAAPWLAPQDWPAACLVNRQWYKVMAPLLWSDPLGWLENVDPGERLDRFFRFATALRLSPSTTRCWVKIVDFRPLRNSALYMNTSTLNLIEAIRTKRELAYTIPRFLRLLSDVRAIYVGPDVISLLETSIGLDKFIDRNPTRVFSLDGHRRGVPTSAFAAPSAVCPDGMWYVDLSNIPHRGLSTTLKKADGDIWRFWAPRVLKIRNSGIDGRDLKRLLWRASKQLICLDVRDNNLDDGALELIGQQCSARQGGAGGVHRRARCSFAIGGRYIRHDEDQGGNLSGLCYQKCIEESDQSGSYDHPNRYICHPTAYTNPDGENRAEDALGDLCSDRAIVDKAQLWEGVMPDGFRRRWPNRSRAESELENPPPGSLDYWLYETFGTGRDPTSSLAGISHLHLSGNKFTVRGIAAMLYRSTGTLTQVDADAVPDFLNPGDYWDPYVLRSVMLPRLATLEIHHSVVTNVLEVPFSSSDDDDERECSNRTKGTQFIPDMNPRMRKLTLTGIPRFAVGDVSDGLVWFLKQLAKQERSIAETTQKVGYGFVLVSGIRKLVLVFQTPPETDSDKQELDRRMRDVSLDEHTPARDASAAEADRPRSPPSLYNVLSALEGRELVGCQNTQTVDVLDKIRQWRESSADTEEWWSGDLVVRYIEREALAASIAAGPD